MSSTSTSLGRGQIVRVGQIYRPLTERLVCKGLEECVGQPPKTDDGLASCLENQISSTLNNIRKDFSKKEIINLIEMTFTTASMLQRLEEDLGLRPRDLRKEFYRDLSRASITHEQEETGFDRYEDRVQHGVDFLLDPNRGADKIPTTINKRSFGDWNRLQKKAVQWAEDCGLSEKVAKEEVIPAAIAVEIHTGGNVDRVEPYKQYIRNKTAEMTLYFDAIK